jgi:hypothetical protein
VTQTAEMFPKTQPFEVEVMDARHKHRIGLFYGIGAVLEELGAVPEHRRAPGFSYALAMVQKLEAEARAALMSDNLRAIAAAGHDINRVANVSLQGATLICTPFAPGEGG